MQRLLYHYRKHLRYCLMRSSVLFLCALKVSVLFLVLGCLELVEENEIN